MKKHLAFLLLALLPLVVLAQPTTTHICDCNVTAGAHASCVPGNDTTGNGSAASPYQSVSRAASVAREAPAGSSVLFGRGCAWNDASMRIENFNSSKASPITLDAYTPSWCTASCASAPEAWDPSGPSVPTRPKLREARVGTTAISFSQGGPEPGTPDEGYVVRNLELIGGYASENNGIFSNRAARAITLSNLYIHGFVIGLYCGDGSYDVALVDSFIRDNSGQGTLFNCWSSRIEGNKFVNNGFGVAILDHHIYIAGIPSRNVTVRFNTLEVNASIGGLCASVPLVAHGEVRDLTIEYNTIIETTAAIADGCWGIAVDGGYPGQFESFANVKIRSNLLVNVGGQGIGINNIRNADLENNRIVYQGTGFFVGIAVRNRNYDGVDQQGSGKIRIRNNSIYMASAAAGSKGITFGEATGNATLSGIEAVNNLIFFASSVNASHQCFDYGGMTIANFTALRENLCYHAAGNGSHSNLHSTLAAAILAGYDLGGLNGNPGLKATPSSANNWKIELSPESIAIDTGNAMYGTRLDYLGRPVSGVKRDIGVDEWRAD